MRRYWDRYWTEYIIQIYNTYSNIVAECLESVITIILNIGCGSNMDRSIALRLQLHTMRHRALLGCIGLTPGKLAACLDPPPPRHTHLSLQKHTRAPAPGLLSFTLSQHPSQLGRSSRPSSVLHNLSYPSYSTQLPPALTTLPASLGVNDRRAKPAPLPMLYAGLQGHS